MSEAKKRWLYTLFFSLILFSLGLAELMIRRQSEATMYLANKSIASTGILLIALSYVLSAIHTFFKVPNKILLLRRSTGLVGYAYVVMHIIVSITVSDPVQPGMHKFPFPDYFTEHPITFMAALLAFGIFTYAFWLSLSPSKHNGTPEKARSWRKKLRYGYVGVLLGFIHMALLKYKGWATWFETNTPFLPPLSLLIAVILSAMVTLKILHLKKEQRIFGQRTYRKARLQEK